VGKYPENDKKNAVTEYIQEKNATK